MSRFILQLIVGSALLWGVASANATPFVNLGLTVDSSGSVGSSNFSTIKSGYAAALASLPTDGSVAVTVYNFSSSGDVQQFSDRVIANTSDRNDLITFVQNMTYFGGTTALSDAILGTGASMFSANLGATKNVIDVSTDGFDNNSLSPLSPYQASMDVINYSGIDQVNCLGIGTSADCSLQAGLGSFSYTNVAYKDFSTILSQKIRREITVPEPSALALFGIGLALLSGLAMNRRRPESEINVSC